MLKSSAIKIIRTFSNEEIQKFEDFLRSPYFNKRSGVVKLFSEIKKFAPDYTHEGLDKKSLWNKLYPDKEFNYGVMKNLIHDLNKLAEDFIIQVEFESNNEEKLYNLLKVLSNKGLKSILSNKDVALKKEYNKFQLNKLNVPVEDYFFYLSKIHLLKLWNSTFVDIKNDFQVQKQFTEGINITFLIVCLINTALSLRTYNDKEKNDLSDYNIIEEILNSIPDKLIVDSIQHLKKHSKTQFIIANSYYLAYKTFKNLQSVESFLEFKTFFFKNAKLLPMEMIRDMDTYLQNTLSFIVDNSFDKRAQWHEILDFKMKYNVILDRNGKINGNQFVPYMFLFIDKSEADKLKLYFNNYKNFIIDEDKDQCILFAESMILFLEKKFQLAFDVICKVKFSSAMLTNILKKYTMMLLFEIKDYEGFLYFYDSYIHFLKYGEWAKKDWMQNYMKKTELFSKNIKKLFQLEESKNIDDILIFKTKIENMNIDNRIWFLRKIEELNKNFK